MSGNQEGRAGNNLSSAQRSAVGKSMSIDGRNLTLEDVVQVARHGGGASLAPSVYDQMEGARRMVEEIVASNRIVYGVTTGFGDLSMTRIPTQDIYRLQQNLIRSHAVGVGPRFPDDVVRAIMLLQANKLCMGHSGQVCIHGLGRPDLPGVPKGSLRVYREELDICSALASGYYVAQLSGFSWQLCFLRRPEEVGK